MSIIAIALIFSGLQGGIPAEKHSVQSKGIVEIDARFVPIISDSGERFSDSGYALAKHIVQIRSQGSLVYIDYIYTAGPGRGGSGAGPCCVSITYEYAAGKFSKSYFAR
ncbi:MAG TPA: hypothetical protein VF680_13190 [Allosphingosinicella sp.]|jgi:hypothetical protein